ncbi:hypothetical protein Tsubulata_049455 [Turnera subulata]|uniref:PLAC8 family protein n=1 Tax=Turnera subulata TaxID=218843 RepID=A0A9Q0JG27_9ROSI|nr:hypothetical protein Tsubulata_049455 [Turnera subulata]
MAHNNNNNNNNATDPVESSPLLSKTHEEGTPTDEKPAKVSDAKPTNTKPANNAAAAGSVAENQYGWTVNGLPVAAHGSVMGEPMGRAQWDSGLLSCLGRNDHFCSSDLEVCLIGSIAPCVLYGSNAERLGSAPGTFVNHCLPYSSLYLIGNSLFGWNCLAPWFSYPTRTAMRRKFNLEASIPFFISFLRISNGNLVSINLIYFTLNVGQQGSFEALNRSCGCCGSCVEDELQREQCETACDFVAHVFCHQCALCQEGREIRRRAPHPGFNAQPVLVMIPPAEQTMARGA